MAQSRDEGGGGAGTHSCEEDVRPGRQAGKRRRQRIGVVARHGDDIVRSNGPSAKKGLIHKYHTGLVKRTPRSNERQRVAVGCNTARFYRARPCKCGPTTPTHAHTRAHTCTPTRTPQRTVCFQINSNLAACESEKLNQILQLALYDHIRDEREMSEGNHHYGNTAVRRADATMATGGIPVIERKWMSRDPSESDLPRAHVDRSL